MHTPKNHQPILNRVLPKLIALPLLLGAGLGALELVQQERYPWPDGYWQDPLRQQMLFTLVLSAVLIYALSEIVRHYPVPEEMDEHYSDD